MQWPAPARVCVYARNVAVAGGGRMCRKLFRVVGMCERSTPRAT